MDFLRKLPQASFLFSRASLERLKFQRRPPTDYKPSALTTSGECGCEQSEDEVLYFKDSILRSLNGCSTSSHLSMRFPRHYLSRPKTQVFAAFSTDANTAPKPRKNLVPAVAGLSLGFSFFSSHSSPGQKMSSRKYSSVSVSEIEGGTTGGGRKWGDLTWYAVGGGLLLIRRRGISFQLTCKS